MSFINEDANDMVEESPDGTFRLRPEIAKDLGALEDVTFPNYEQAIQMALLIRLSYRKGQIHALRQVREALGIRT